MAATWRYIEGGAYLPSYPFTIQTPRFEGSLHSGDWEYLVAFRQQSSYSIYDLVVYVSDNGQFRMLKYIPGENTSTTPFMKMYRGANGITYTAKRSTTETCVLRDSDNGINSGTAPQYTGVQFGGVAVSTPCVVESGGVARYIAFTLNPYSTKIQLVYTDDNDPTVTYVRPTIVNGGGAIPAGYHFASGTPSDYYITADGSEAYIHRVRDSHPSDVAWYTINLGGSSASCKGMFDTKAVGNASNSGGFSCFWYYDVATATRIGYRVSGYGGYAASHNQEIIGVTKTVDGKIVAAVRSSNDFNTVYIVELGATGLVFRTKITTSGAYAFFQGILSQQSDGRMKFSYKGDGVKYAVPCLRSVSFDLMASAGSETINDLTLTYQPTGLTTTAVTTGGTEYTAQTSAISAGSTIGATTSVKTAAYNAFTTNYSLGDWFNGAVTDPYIEVKSHNVGFPQLYATAATGGNVLIKPMSGVLSYSLSPTGTGSLYPAFGGQASYNQIKMLASDLYVGRDFAADFDITEFTIDSHMPGWSNNLIAQVPSANGTFLTGTHFYTVFVDGLANKQQGY